MSRNGNVIVAMSGGVDSSVAACLLKEQGYDCVGVFMRVGTHLADVDEPYPLEPGRAAASEHGRHGRARPEQAGRATPEQTGRATAERRLKHGCCSVADALDARAIAGKLDIPFYVLNFEHEFGRIIDYFVDEYARARTPNPCVMCNIQLKFGKLLEYADTLDAEFVATGHYARILRTPPPVASAPRGRRSCDQTYPSDAPWRTVFLARSLNRAKDQSYVLFGIRREDLSRCLFPLGEIADKADVRRIAVDLGLRVHDKPESQEICFVPDDDYKTLVRERRPETLKPGDVRDSAGNLLGKHEGVASFTIGQRRGLGIAAGIPIYVTKLDAATNTVTVGRREELLSSGLIADQLNWLTDAPLVGESRPAEIKIRYMHTPAAGSIRRLESDSPHRGAQSSTLRAVVEATFDQPQPAVTPGQAAVFYEPDGTVLGGGWIWGSIR
jgi:tRNA-specific 2-thiouridylase